MTNTVYIATSIDGYIADKEGGLDWLHSIPNPDQSDFGWADFMATRDALVMGRNTFETVVGFGGDWPYPIPVYVLSNTLKSLPEELEGKVHIVSGDLKGVAETLNQQGINNLYIDGGKTIQSFLKNDLIDEMIITQIPVLLGGGASLFGELEGQLDFEFVESNVLLGAMVQTKFKRKR